MQIDPNDRIGGPAEQRRPILIWVAVIAGVAGLLGVAGAAFLKQDSFVRDLIGSGQEIAAFKDVYEHLGIAGIPDGKARAGAVKRRLEALQREKCDTIALFELTKELAKQGYRREAATSLVSFSAKCSSNEKALIQAYQLFSQLNDHSKMIETANQLIDLKDFASTYHYWRGLGYMKQNSHASALDDFITAIELQPDMRRIKSSVFINQSKMYEELGRNCEAVTPIQTWVSLDPAKRDTQQSRSMIARIAERGDCSTTYATGSARFPVTSNKGILVQAKINGKPGRFLLDTGASFVSLSNAFAKRATLDPITGSRIKLHTANGVVFAKTAIAKSITVDSADSNNVTVVIMEGEKNAFGPGIDGLLGMSFLARFELKVGTREWSIAARDN